MLQMLLPPPSHLAALPLVGDAGSEPLLTHHLPHVLDGGVRRHQVVIRQLKIFMKTWQKEAGF